MFFSNESVLCFKNLSNLLEIYIFADGQQGVGSRTVICRLPRGRRPHRHLHRCLSRPAAVDIAVRWGRGI